MQKLMTGAMALAILASTGAASAQEQPQNHPALRRSWRNPAPEAPRPPQAQQAPQAQPAPQARDAGGERRNWQGDRNRGDGDRGRGDRGDRNRGGDDNRRWEGRAPDRGGPDRRPDDGRRDWDGRRDGRDWNDGRTWNDNRRWDNNDRRRDQPRPRYDRRHYEPIWRSQQRYRGWAYRPPTGFYVRSWAYGDILPRGWWGNDYRIMDWWAYGLPIPPLGFEWVRVGDDALLVDMYSGRVVQVAYDLFW